MTHLLNCYEIDSLDEQDDQFQIARVWCETHRRYEWHNIHLDYVRHGGTVRTERKPLWER